MKLYKSEFDILSRIIKRKNFTFPDFSLVIEDGMLKSSGYCEEKTFIYNLKQKLVLPNDDKIEFVFPTEEFLKIFKVFSGNNEVNFEMNNDKLLVYSSDGKKFLIREAICSTTAPILKFDENNFDVLNIEPIDFKQVVSGLTSIGAEEITLTTSGITLDSYCINDMQSILKTRSKVDNTKTSGSTGKSVKFDNLIVDVVDILDPLEIVELKMGETEPFIAIQKNESMALELILVPLVV